MYACSGSGSGGVDGDGEACALDVTLAVMGDVGGAECILGDDIRECGRFMGAIGGEARTLWRGRVGESGLEGANGS
jgi:hypothetical protein